MVEAPAGAVEVVVVAVVLVGGADAGVVLMLVQSVAARRKGVDRAPV